MNKIATSFLLAFGLFGVCSVHAAWIKVVPDSEFVAAGHFFEADILIGGLPDHKAPSVGAFDLEVNFNPLNISANGFVFGDFLGNEAAGEVLTDVVFGDNVVSVAAVSLLSNIELDA